MITMRKSDERGHSDFGWLDSRHSFSFGEYYDPKHMGFRALRVINDDRVAGGGGFPTHPHRDMEILTWVLDGALSHADSMGNEGEVIRPGDLQRMTAGTGVRHSEFNASDTEPVRLLQIWILPEKQGLTPSYEQRHFDVKTGDGLRLVAAPTGADGAVQIRQDVRMYVGKLNRDQRTSLELEPGRHAWVQVARGSVSVNGQTFDEGDAAQVSGETKLELAGRHEDAEVLVFDLA